MNFESILREANILSQHQTATIGVGHIEDKDRYQNYLEESGLSIVKETPEIWTVSNRKK